MVDNLLDVKFAALGQYFYNFKKRYGGASVAIKYVNNFNSFETFYIWMAPYRNSNGFCFVWDELVANFDKAVTSNTKTASIKNSMYCRTHFSDSGQQNISQSWQNC